MDYLWTPWRFQYISATDKSPDCILCAAVKANRDSETLIVHRGEHCFVILNRFPYNSGHLMIAPYRHIPLLEDASLSERQDMMELSARCQRLLREVYRPEGFNLGMNLGKCAGAGVAEHIHMHLLPRWSGDANFMSVVGETRVLPEELKTTFQKLSTRF